MRQRTHLLYMVLVTVFVTFATVQGPTVSATGHMLAAQTVTLRMP